MPKKTNYTQVTPLPRQVPRQLAIDMLHSHGEYIELNPLVTGHRAIPAPRDAAADEYFAQWHEIDEVVPVALGVKKKISFRGVFHDMPWGLQTHTYGPLGIDLRIKWQVRGNQPGEPPEPRELGIDTPRDGLYLRADVEIICNITLAGLVKKEMKSAATVMVERLTRKAELLDQGQLQAMFEDGKLKTVNPAQEAHLANARNALNDVNGQSTQSVGQVSPPGSPMFSEKSFEADGKSYGNYHDIARAHSSRNSTLSPSFPQHGFPSPDMRRVSQISYSNSSEFGSQPVPQVPSHIAEAPGNYYHPQAVGDDGQAMKPYGGATFTAELPGNDHFLSPNGHRLSYPADNKQAAHYSVTNPTPPQSHANGQRSPSPSTLSGSGAQSSPAPLYPTESQELPADSISYKPYTPPASTTPDRRRSSSQTQVQQQQQQNYQPYVPPPATSVVAEDKTWSTQQLRDSLPSRKEDPAVPAALRPRSTQGIPGVQQYDVKDAVKCPVCKEFEGDEAAVSHHVSSHFQ